MQQDSGAASNPDTPASLTFDKPAFRRAQRAELAALGIKKSGNITRKVRDARNAADKLGPAEANAKVQEFTARVAELEAEVSSLHRTNPDRPP